MYVKDIDKKLDMRLVLKLRQDTEFFEATKDLGMTLPVYIFGANSSTMMSTYFPREDRNQKIELLKMKFKGIHMENSIAIDTRINNVKDLAIINEISKVPSFILNRSDMSNGFLNVYGRFHSSQIGTISDLLAKYTADSENSRISWLGPSMGIMKITDMINEQYPLSAVCYTVSMDSDEQEYIDLYSTPGIMAEVRNSMYNNGKISVVLYTDKPLEAGHESIETVSAKDGVYQVDVSNKFHNLVRELANERHLMRTRYFIQYHENKLELQVFLPTSMVYEYYSILYKIAREHQNNIVVKTLMPYSSEVWNFI